MESYQHENSDGYSALSRALENAFADQELDVSVTSFAGEMTIECAGIHRFQVVIQDKELVIDYVESNGDVSGRARHALEALKTFGTEYEYDLRASGVLSEAVGFWEEIGFAEDEHDYVYETQ